MKVQANQVVEAASGARRKLMADGGEQARTRRLLAASLLLGGLLLGLLFPGAWTGGGTARAANNVVYKCVGFTTMYDSGHHRDVVYFHNDSPKPVGVDVVWFGVKGQYIWAESQTVPAGGTGEASLLSSNDGAVRIAEILTASPVLILDAEEMNVPTSVGQPQQRQQVTCSPATTIMPLFK
jgi:hypothetical protein